jgi:hypothetical protein
VINHVQLRDRDEEFPMEHTLTLHGGLPDTQLAVLPGAGRGLEFRIVIDLPTEREEEE